MEQELKLMTWDELKNFYTPGQLTNSIKNIGINGEINKLNNNGKSLLIIAAMNNFSRTIIEDMLTAGADFCLRSESRDIDGNVVYGKNALEYAIAYNSQRALECFLKWSENSDLKKV